MTVLKPMETAPMDGTPILIKFKDDFSGSPNVNHLLSGLWFVGRNHGDCMNWRFAAPIGYGGLSADWFVGWMPLPELSALEGE